MDRKPDLSWRPPEWNGGGGDQGWETKRFQLYNALKMFVLKNLEIHMTQY